jgi:predicted dehydrogenase
MNVGLIGTGGIVETAHLPAIGLVEGVEVVAVLSRSMDSADDFVARHKLDATSYIDVDTFVADPNIDLVIIGSPDKLHYEQAKKCLQAGKHVLVEKPITTEIAEVEELVQLAKDNNLLLMTGFHLRHHNGLKTMYDKIYTDKVIGDIRHIRAIWAIPFVDDSNWRAHEDLGKWWSLSAVGSHCIDLSRWLANDMGDWQTFKSVTVNNKWRGQHDETAVLSGQLSNGVTIEIVSSVQFGPYNRLEIYGSTGMALCDDAMGRLGSGSITINCTPLLFDPQPPFVSQLRFAKQAIISGNYSSLSDPGLRSVKDLCRV